MPAVSQQSFPQREAHKSGVSGGSCTFRGAFSFLPGLQKVKIRVWRLFLDGWQWALRNQLARMEWDGSLWLNLVELKVH